MLAYGRVSTRDPELGSKIVKFLAADGPSVTAKIASGVKFNAHSIVPHLRALQESGLIVKDGPHWRIK